MASSYLVTGSSRGLGLALVTHLLSLPASKVKVVFATARDPKNSACLASLANSPEGRGRIVLVTLDVTKKESVDSAAATVLRSLGSGAGIDVLINNARVISGYENIINLTDEKLMQNLQTNALGAHRVIKAFLPLLRKGREKKIINLGATLSSMTVAYNAALKAPPLPIAGYAISKTTLNMMSMQWALILKDESFIVTVICPGWVQSDMGGPEAQLTKEVAAMAIIQKVDDLDSSCNGKFLKTLVSGMETAEPMYYDGSEIPW